MRHTIKLFGVFILYIVSSCNLFDKEAFDKGFEEDQNLEYVVPTTIPASEQEFKQLLHGSDQNAWVAQEFSLESLLGNQDCRLDDTMMLKADGTYQFDGGKTSCGGEDVVQRSGVFKIDYDSKKLIFDEGTDDEVQVSVSGLDTGVTVLEGQVEIFGVAMDIKGVYTTE